jgi:chromosome segregation ATPase
VYNFIANVTTSFQRLTCDVSQLRPQVHTIGSSLTNAEEAATALTSRVTSLENARSSARHHVEDFTSRLDAISITLVRLTDRIDAITRSQGDLAQENIALRGELRRLQERR